MYLWSKGINGLGEKRGGLVRVAAEQGSVFGVVLQCRQAVQKSIDSEVESITHKVGKCIALGDHVAFVSGNAAVCSDERSDLEVLGFL